MTEGNNPTDRSKLGTKRHILTDKKGIPLSTVITSASTHDIKAETKMLWICSCSNDLIHYLIQKKEDEEESITSIYALIESI